MSSAEDAGSTASNKPLYIGLGAGVGGLLVVGIVAILVKLILQCRRAHARSDTRLRAPKNSETVQVCNPGLFDIEANGSGWTALASRENVNEPVEAGRRSIISAIHLPKRMKKRGIALRRLKHLSAIVESPRSRHVPSMTANVVTIQEKEVHEYVYGEAAKHIAREPENDVFVEAPQMQSWECLFSDRPRAPRSVSVSALLGPQNGLQRSMSGNLPGLRTHVRSISLGAAPPDQLPPDPTPQAVIAPMCQERPIPMRSQSRDSFSSETSAGSSVLVNSPFLNRRKSQGFANGGHPASLKVKKSANRVVVVNGSHDPQAHIGVSDSRVSLLTEEERASIGYLVSLSSVSSLSEDDSKRASYRFPARSGGSPRSNRSRRTQNSARRVSRFSVSADGSPTGCKRSGPLQDISNNLTSREDSTTSLRSNDSSNGNPFQWDHMAGMKPSAMKGSPTARKGHKRQNCVRISTLTPQVLGPPPSRPDSPSITHGIKEELQNENSPGSLTFVTNKKLSRPNSISANNSLRVKTLRASLTPSSPTLSLWATYSDYKLPSQASDSHLTVSSAGRLSRTGSGISSIYSIPQFPSPSTVTVSQVQHDRAVPEFSIAAPETNSSTSPFTSQEGPTAPSPRSWSPGSATRERPRQLSPQDQLDERVQWSSRPPSTVSLSSVDGLQNDSERLSPPATYQEFHKAGLTRTASRNSFKATLENASASPTHLQNKNFPGAPILRPPPDLEAGTPPHNSPPGMNILSTRQRRCSPSGPRTEPPKSVSKIAMELRRMNSEIDTSIISHETRRYLRFDREASPILPMFGSPNPSESCNSLFDFGFDAQAGDTERRVSRNLSSKDRDRLAKLQAAGPGTPTSLYDADGFLQV